MIVEDKHQCFTKFTNSTAKLESVETSNKCRAGCRLETNILAVELYFRATAWLDLLAVYDLAFVCASLHD